MKNISQTEHSFTEDESLNPLKSQMLELGSTSKHHSLVTPTERYSKMLRSHFPQVEAAEANTFDQVVEEALKEAGTVEPANLVAEISLARLKNIVSLKLSRIAENRDDMEETSQILVPQNLVASHQAYIEKVVQNIPHLRSASSLKRSTSTMPTDRTRESSTGHQKRTSSFSNSTSNSQKTLISVSTRPQPPRSKVAKKQKIPKIPKSVKNEDIGHGLRSLSRFVKEAKDERRKSKDKRIV